MTNPTAWHDLLTRLRNGVERAPRDDLWYFLTAAGLTEDSLTDAGEAVDFVMGRAGDLSASRVADLGCGVGRHLFKLAQQCGQAVGIESSADLAALASHLVPDAAVVVASYHDVAKFGTFDAILAFSHALMLTDAADGVRGNLQLLRGAMPDYGLLVVEEMPVAPVELVWDVAEEVTVHERRATTKFGCHHHFDIATSQGAWSREIASQVVAPADWGALAEECGFHLERAELFTYSDGTSSFFYFLRAQKGYNFLSDLPEFLEAWADPGHDRNQRTVEWADDETGSRIRPTGIVGPGQGAALSKHHPDFAVSLEARVRPLVLELATQWNYVTYSSCEGHLVEPGPPQVYCEAYCGIVTFSNKQISTLTRLVDFAREGLELSHINVDLRIRPLHGTGTTLTAADVLFRRAQPGTAWPDYRSDVQQAVAHLCTRLRQADER